MKGPSRDRRERQAVAWWSWPSLLAIDAPIVGVTWLVAFGGHVGRPVGVVAALVVGISIWLVYVADRVVDVARIAAADRSGASDGTDPASSAPTGSTTPRHTFAVAARGPLAAVWWIALVAVVALAIGTLSNAALLAGAIVTGAAATTLSVRMRTSRAGASFRALLVGMSFAGAMVVGMDGAMPWRALPLLATFGVTCAANIALIGIWERHLRDGADGPNAPAWVAIGFATIALAGSTLLAVTGGGILAQALAASALSLVGLHLVHDRLAPDLARACADAALVAPFALLVLLTLAGARA